MAKLEQEFSPADVPEDDRSFDPIPVGSYQLQVIDSKIDDTKSGTGQLLTLTLEVIDGPYAGRRIWDRLNIQNQNPDAQRIGQRSLADLCIMLEIMELDDTEELHFKPFVAKVTVAPDKSGQYGPQNRVRYNGGKAATPPAQKATAAKPAMKHAAKPQASATKGDKPWAARRPAADNNEPPF